MPKFVSELQTALEQYVHPDLTFINVLNEVLPQLASRGIWKDLTFEETIQLKSEDRFFSLPDDADAVLWAMVNNEATPVKPLWNAFSNDGAEAARMGGWYGIEDAGYVPTQDILSDEYHYSLFLLPHYSTWGTEDALEDLYTLTAFQGTEVVTVRYINWEGVEVTSSTSVTATSAVQPLNVRAARSIISISYDGFDTTKGQILALPVKHYGSMDSAGAGSFTVGPLVSGDPSFPSDFTDLTAVSGFAQMYSMSGDASFDDTLVSVVAASDTSMTGSAYGGSSATSEPVVFWPEAFYFRDDVATKTGYAEEAKKVCVCDGAGISRYRIFRQQAPGNRVHLLLRKKLPVFADGTDIVDLDNLSALKYAILANTAEYNNDITQARAWWAEAERELNAELDKTLGAAQPQVVFDPSAGQGSIESLQ